MEKIYKFAKKFGFAFNYREDFKSGTVNCFMIAPKTDIVFDYAEIDGEATILINKERFSYGVDRALNYYEELLILKGEFNGKF
jgi:hypothetical protein